MSTFYLSNERTRPLLLLYLNYTFQLQIIFVHEQIGCYDPSFVLFWHFDVFL